MSLRAFACCLLVFLAGASPAIAQEYLWCYNEDSVSFALDPAIPQLTIEHRAAMYNCCPEPVSYQVELGEGILTVTEIVGADPPCDCICCFNLKAEVTGLPSGLWTVRFTWLNEEDWQWLTEETQLVVPGPTEMAPAVQVDHEISDCLDVSAVPDQPADPSWDAVKAWYR